MQHTMNADPLPVGALLLNGLNSTQKAEISDEELGRLDDVTEAVSDEVFVSYEHSEIIPGCRPHPGNIVEAGSLAHIPPPSPTYPLANSLPPELIREGKLSSLQLTGCLYACQRHQIILANGSRAGYFIGDAAGVGKGRQISGIILDNYARGRTRHIWFSISTDLIVDARRDMGDIGCHLRVIEGAQQLDKETKVFGLPRDFKDGVVFSTYATLVSSVQRGGAFGAGKQSRLQQLVSWCGGADFEGCLVFDECHKAKNFDPRKEQNSTKVALAVATLQRMLPKARVVYCSATGVSDVKNMAFMERLGLWGEGASFKNFEKFYDTIQRKGLGVAEMLAMEMKTSGMYVCRGLSFKQTEFTSVEVPLSKENIRMYDTAAHVWREVFRSLSAALDRTGSSSRKVWSAYWGAHQRFFRQLCIGLKVPAVVEDAKRALDSGQCVVIGLQTTGEASLEAELAQSKKPLNTWVSLCREILRRFITQHFPTTLEKPPPPGASPLDDWCITAKQMLIGFADQITLPNSPLDLLIDQLGGPSCVAEMTGRRGRIIRRHPTDSPRYELRDNENSGGFESLNVRERNEFMEGKKFVAIISDAASTGISLHADERVGNQRRRVHVTLELPWSADKAVQQLGRSHRSNQTSGPLYKLMTTSLGGEKRFASAVARRLESLGALTKGDRRAASGVNLMEFNYDTPYGRIALKNMYSAICTNLLPTSIPLSAVAEKGETDMAVFNADMLECLREMDVMEFNGLIGSQKVKDSDARDVSKFLNRILSLSVDKQNRIFNYFAVCLDTQISMARKEGRYNEGLVDIMASSVQMKTQPVEVFKSTTSRIPTKHVVLRVDRGMSWEKALARLKHYESTHSSFYKSKREMWGQTFYILATLKEGSSYLYKISRPNTGISSFEEEKADLLHKYSPISLDVAERGWNQQYEGYEEHCIHGPHCKASRRTACTVGCRVYDMHLLCGAIVTMMSVLETTILRFGTQLSLSKAESGLRVVRVKLDSGERVVGVRYPETLIPEVEKAISEEVAVAQSVMAANESSQSTPVATIVKKEAVHLSYEEPIAPVNPRLLQKATSPPLTIRTFFKPTTEPKAKVDENSNSPASKRPTRTESLKSPASSLQKRATESLNSPSCQKRAAEALKSPPPPAKRQKQLSCLDAFARMRTKEQKKRTCPICNKVFDFSALNTEINKHIDNCLIE